MLLLAYLKARKGTEYSLTIWHREEDVSFLPELAVWPELKLEELMSELALVSDIVAQVEVVGHVDANLQILFQMIM